jgi:hypothetical protein
MSDDPLVGPKLKIKRAFELVGELERICEAYLAGNHYELVIEHDPASGDRLAKIKITAPIPDALYMIVAETIYHLRSSLDQMIVAIARVNSVAGRELSFPFPMDRNDFESAKTQNRMKGLPRDVVSLIRKFEPFQGGNDRLWGIGPLSNVDKHNMLVPVGSLGGVDLYRGLKISKAKTGIVVSPRGRLDQGIVISNLGTDDALEFRGQPNFSIISDIVFADVAVFEGERVSATLNELTALVEGIILTFEAHCFRQEGNGSPQ